MKSIKLLLYIILITWRIVDCEKDDSYHAISAVDLIEEIEENTEFVDPYSFDYDRANKKMLARHSTVSKAGKSTGSNGVCVNEGQCRKELKQCQDALGNVEVDRLYTMRLINLLLSSAKLEEQDGFLTGSITLSGEKIQIEELRRFSDGKITIRQVDSILSNIIKPRTKTSQETALDFVNRLHIVAHEYKGSFMAVSAVLVVLLLYRYVNWSIGKIMFAFLLFGLIMSYVMMWEQLRREAELKQYVKMNQNKERPIECDPEKMSFWEQVKSLLHWEDKCLEYYKAAHLDASHEINPIDPLLQLFDKVVIQFGSSMGGFIDNATKHLWSPMWALITPMLYLLIPVLIICYFIPLRLWFGPFFSVAVGGGQRNETRRETPVIDQRQPPMIEQRQPITQIHITYDSISPMVSVRNSEAEMRILGPSPMAQAIESNTSAIGGGDSETRRQETRQENSGAMCTSCCCKTSLKNSPHIEEDGDLTNEETKNEVQSREKGDGDC